MNDRMKKLYMDIATRCSCMSRAKRLQVGCVVVKGDDIISFSWNGTPAGWDNNCEKMENGNLVTLPEVHHAERNALDKLAKSTNMGGQGSTMFVTHSPCLECAKSIYSTGITTIYYKEEYRSTDGIDFLKKCNVNVIQYKD